MSEIKSKKSRSPAQIKAFEIMRMKLLDKHKSSADNKLKIKKDKKTSKVLKPSTKKIKINNDITG